MYIYIHFIYLISYIWFYCLSRRNALLEWDFGREINCLCRRLGIEPTEKIKDSFVTEAYAEQEVQRTKELGLGYKPVRSNIAMAQEGHEKLREILSVQLRESYPFLPSQALNSLLEYLTSGETLVDVATQMGLAPFVFRTGKIANYYSIYVLSVPYLKRTGFYKVCIGLDKRCLF